MNPVLKRILIVVGFLAAVVGFALLIWWQFFLVPVPTGTNANRAFLGRVLPEIADQLKGNRNENRRVVNGAIANINGALPNISPIAQGGLTLARPVVETSGNYTVVGNDLRYYDPITGQFYTVSRDGKTKTLLTDKKFSGAESVTWANDGSKAVLAFPDGAKIIYDFAKQQQFSMPNETEGFSFSPEGNSLAFKFLGRDESDRWLAVANSDGSQAQFVEPIGDKVQFVTPQWSPNRQVVATYASSASGSQQEVIFLGAHSENYPSALLAGRGFQGQWTPDGNSILYTVRSAETLDNPTLWIMDGRTDSLGQRQINLGVQTFMDKCAFDPSGISVVCGVPKYLPQGAGRFPELARDIPDDFYRIDLRTGGRDLIASPTDAAGSASYNATDVRVSEDGAYLYFRDRITNRLHEIRLQ